MKLQLAIVSASLALSGCATIFNGQSQTVVIASKPEGANVSVTNRAGEAVHAGMTPVTLTLKRGHGYFKPEIYTIKFEKTGFDTREVVITGSTSGWYIGNLLFGGLIGMLAVDPVTGAMYVFPDRVDQELSAASVKTSSDTRSLQVVSFDTLSADQRAQARLIGAIK